MTGLIVTFVQVAACLGYGALGLRVLGLGDYGLARERRVYAFALGMGLIGWIVFFFGVCGVLNQGALITILGIGTFAALFTRSVFLQGLRLPAGSALTYSLLAALALVWGMDVLEALTPTGDADTLAYHFALPKQFLAAGRIEFVPRALDGAIAMLTHMTYIPVLGLGGEESLLQWVFFSGWVAVFTVYTLARRHLGVDWSLALALAFSTTPAVVYGAGSGQVEVRNLIFVVAATLVVTANDRHKGLVLSILAGLFAGFFVGSKFLGLMFAAVCGLAVLWEKRRLGPGLAYGLAGMIAGGQWYIWNAIHIGDPVFPMLFEWLGFADTPYWSDKLQGLFRTEFVKSYTSVSANFFWFLAYPFKATLDGAQAFESARIGFGPLVWLLLPFALAGAWKFRAALRTGPLLTYILITLFFYASWFFSDSPQKVRFLLPILPLLLVPVTVAAVQFSARTAAFWPLLAAMAITLVLQVGGQTLYTLKSARYVFGDETKEQYLLRTVADFQPAPWINAHLGPHDRLLIRNRHYLYYLDVPYYYAHPQLQALVDLSPDAADLKVFLSQIRGLGITYLLLPNPVERPFSSLWRLSAAVEAAGCLVAIKTFATTSFASRTLPTLKARQSNFTMYRLVDNGCQYS